MNVFDCFRIRPEAGSNWSMLDRVLRFLSLPRNLSLDSGKIYWILLFCQVLKKFGFLASNFDLLRLGCFWWSFFLIISCGFCKELYASHGTVSCSRHTLLEVRPKARDCIKRLGVFGTSRIKTSALLPS